MRAEWAHSNRAMSAPRQVLDAIGNTPLVELRRVVPAGSARIIAKLESANPTGSMTVGTIIIDSGLGYVSTDVFRT